MSKQYLAQYQDYLLLPDKDFPQNVRISRAGKGGSVPAELSGLYTSRVDARLAIDAYLAKPAKGRSNAKTKSNTSR